MSSSLFADPYVLAEAALLGRRSRLRGTGRPRAPVPSRLGMLVGDDGWICAA
jgi:hypothetical protein